MASRGTPIENGIPIYGTWAQAFESVDLLDIQRPFPYPLPRGLRTLRVKEWEAFTIQDDHFYLDAFWANVKYYHIAQVSLYDKETQEQLCFNKIIPFGGRHLPRNLWNSSVVSRSYGFFFRIHNWLDAQTIKVDLDIEATHRRPSFTAHLEFALNHLKTPPMAVNLPFSERRCMYAFKAFSAVRGDMVFGGRHISLDPAKTTGIFRDYKGFFPYRMRSTWCTAAAAGEKNSWFGFSIAENQAKETFKNNENALWQEGRLTPLPPVRITMPNGVESDWVIQDVEGMVDLTFTPQKKIRSSFNLLLTKWEYNTPLGYYNGMLVNAEGEQIPVHNLWGLGEKLYLRV
ncbi:hypothetical protein TREPR_0509 [Treponema primitia ZAS-2]|uniref:DUF2804 domain-containing protein n=1 Tax=Treponema primitia (strain ATCC BAA-887 / DSM 12427 / ZAS-2) TaxID=545694 RepID=F5YLD1_TREPZ|nr:DUF2804 domain-containing protein [Treponema primitia]AEF86465.1 hypothetical protein TREPR_0509 [Treponema primitia ZAS-2]